MHIEFKDRPYPKQVQFLKAKTKFVAFGGARGGGKSHIARRKALLLALNPKFAGIQIMFLRRRYNDIFENHIYPLQKELNGLVKFNQKTKSFDFPWGSRILFGYCDNDGDILQYQGKAYDAIFVEEATQFTEFMLVTLQESLRPSGMMKSYENWTPRMFFTCNPGGVGHSYIKRLFIDKKYRNKEKPEDYTFIPSTIYENQFLMENDPSYVELLENLPEQRKKAMLYGDWDVYQGQFFTEFRNNAEGYITRKHTNVIAPFRINSQSMRLYRVMDWGYAKPFAIYWIAVDYDEVAYIYREWYGTTGETDVGIRYTPEQVAKYIREIEETYEDDVYIEGIADPAIFATDTGKSIAETFEECGVYFEPADNTRLTGWAQMRERIKKDEEGYAMLYVFDTCEHLIRTLPGLIHDEKKVEDLDTTQEDHAADAVRYWCMARPIANRITKKKALDQKAYNPLSGQDSQRNNYYGLGVLLNRK